MKMYMKKEYMLKLWKDVDKRELAEDEKLLMFACLALAIDEVLKKDAPHLL